MNIEISLSHLIEIVGPLTIRIHFDSPIMENEVRYKGYEPMTIERFYGKLQYTIKLNGTRGRQKMVFCGLWTQENKCLWYWGPVFMHEYDSLTINLNEYEKGSGYKSNGPICWN